MADPNANPICLGIIGCAEIARKVSRTIGLAPNAVIITFDSCSVEKAQLFITTNAPPDFVKAIGSYVAILDDPNVDAVYVPLSTSLHVKWAPLVVQKRKHMLLEKPTVLCVTDLDRILEACSPNGVQFMDSTIWMDNLRTAKMKEMLSDPTQFGELKTI